MPNYNYFMIIPKAWKKQNNVIVPWLASLQGGARMERVLILIYTVFRIVMSLFPLYLSILGSSYLDIFCNIKIASEIWNKYITSFADYARYNRAVGHIIPCSISAVHEGNCVVKQSIRLLSIPPLIDDVASIVKHISSIRPNPLLATGGTRNRDTACSTVSKCATFHTLVRFLSL